MQLWPLHCAALYPLTEPVQSHNLKVRWNNEAGGKKKNQSQHSMAHFSSICVSGVYYTLGSNVIRTITRVSPEVSLPRRHCVQTTKGSQADPDLPNPTLHNDLYLKSLHPFLPRQPETLGAQPHTSQTHRKCLPPGSLTAPSHTDCLHPL